MFTKLVVGNTCNTFVRGCVWFCDATTISKRYACMYDLIISEQKLAIIG